MEDKLASDELVVANPAGHRPSSSPWSRLRSRLGPVGRASTQRPVDGYLSARPLRKVSGSGSCRFGSVTQETPGGAAGPSPRVKVLAFAAPARSVWTAPTGPRQCNNRLRNAESPAPTPLLAGSESLYGDCVRGDSSEVYQSGTAAP
jgi:hypothetical protein